MQRINQSIENERSVEAPLNRKELNPSSSLRAAFGARLRSAREKRGWTQDDLAERMGYSSVHISAVETARKSPTLRFSRSADRAFGREGADTFEREWRELRHGSALEGFPEYVECEGRAVEIRTFEIGVIPGLVQTPEYAAVLAGHDVKRGATTDDQARERVSLVAERQAAFVRSSPPLIFVMLDESCIRRPIGEPAVMDAQLARLVEFAELPNTVLQIAPFAMGVRRSFHLPVTILTMADRSLISYAESMHRGRLERESTFGLSFLTAYHQLQAEACSQPETVAMINQLRTGTA